MSEVPLPAPIQPPGWYPANVAGYERWWDGTGWTESLRPVQGAIPGSQPPANAPNLLGGSSVGFGGPGLTDQRTSSVEITLAWIFAVLTLTYMLPWAIAATRGKSNSVAIALVNLFLGWTFIGWVVALVMACTAHQQRMAVVQMVNVPHYYGTDGTSGIQGPTSLGPPQ